MKKRNPLKTALDLLPEEYRKYVKVAIGVIILILLGMSLLPGEVGEESQTKLDKVIQNVE